jgi:hypothetical protein
MSTKDYKLIAAGLRASRPERDGTMTAVHKRDAWRDVVDALAVRLLADNPRFNRATFLRACGVEIG